VQGVLARSPSEAGSVVTPMLVAWPTASFLVGRNSRRLGFRVPVVAGLAAVAAASFVAALAYRPPDVQPAVAAPVLPE
jgi:hypothetical protein